MQPPYVYRATVTNVVDGDTVDAVVDLGFNVQTTIRFRLNGINTAETNSSNPAERDLANKAKQFVTERALNHQVMLKTYKTDKYGRWLADVFVGQAVISINQQLVSEGLAQEYSGGQRTQLT